MNPTILARPILLATLAAVASPAFAVECFSMFDVKNALVYQSSTTPIDLSRSISDQMARRFPRRYLVISDLGACPPSGVVASGTPTQAAALLPSSTGDGPGAYGADATSPAPVDRSQPVDAYTREDGVPVRSFARPASARR